MSKKDSFLLSDNQLIKTWINMAAALITSEILPRTSEENVQLRKNIYISSSLTDSKFYSVITDALDKIEENPIGKRLLDKISLRAGEIFITPGEKSEISSSNWDLHLVVTISTTEVSCFSTNAELIPYPLHVILFHELVHGYHRLSFKRGSEVVDSLVWSDPEEYKAIMGFPSKNPEKKTPKITENSFRAAEGLPLRGAHLPTDCPEWVKIRIRHLGRIYERHLADSASSQAPPPVIKYSAENLGCLPEDCIVYAEISGVDSDFTPREDMTTPHIMLSATEMIGHLMEEECYVDLSHLDSRCTREEIACTFFPKLKNVKTFSVHQLIGLKITKEENELLG